MNWNTRIKLWSIIVTVFAVAVIDFPTVPINIHLGSFDYEGTLKGPDINLFNKVERKLDVKLGLDLQGGTKIVLSADMEGIDDGDKQDKLTATKEVIENRINRYGIVEPITYTQTSGGDNQIVIELPGAGSDVEKQIELVKQTAKLVFWEEKEFSTIPEITEENSLQALFDPNFGYQPTEVTGEDLKDANWGFDQSSQNDGNSQLASIDQAYAINLDFTAEGSVKFNDMAIKNRGKSIAPILDGQFILGSDGIPLRPVVNEGLGTPGGKLESTVITGNFTKEEAVMLATQLKAGALPLDVKVVEQTSVEATLGRDALDKSLAAGVVGLFLIMLFMIYHYGRFGLIADLALVIYVLVSLALFKLIPITLTLAGIAGFVMSIGVAVDANILIFERMLEERRKGRNQLLAVRLGFDRAWTSIRDSNIATLITCLILFYAGTTQVRGFALTLGIGVMVSLLTAVLITRFMINLYTSTRKGL